MKKKSDKEEEKAPVLNNKGESPSKEITKASKKEREAVRPKKLPYVPPTITVERVKLENPVMVCSSPTKPKKGNVTEQWQDGGTQSRNIEWNQGWGGGDRN